MRAPKKSKDEVLEELVELAGRMNIEVRKEKLLREVGYHAHSGCCRLNGRNLIILDRDAPVADQVEFLAAELHERKSETS